MHVLRTVASLREHVSDLRAASTTQAGVGFVPTMGALHDGHLSLVAAARAQHEIVVMSIFVNPKQFEDGGDFSSYPRDEARDLELAKAAGVDVVFLPDVSEIYPEGFATTVRVDERLTGVLEGEVRGADHFNGMATVVTKLLLAVMPHAAYFGAKDFQQVVVVRRFVNDLGVPVRIVSCPTLREHDGLALSSRNVRLSAHEREMAAAIPRALDAVSEAVSGGQTSVAQLQQLGVNVLTEAGLTVEYLAIVHPETLQAVDSVTSNAVCAVAVSTESTRLIDNAMLIAPISERE